MVRSFPTCPVLNNYSRGCPFEQTDRLTGEVGVLGRRHEADCRESSFRVASGFHYGKLLQYHYTTILANSQSVDAMNCAEIW